METWRHIPDFDGDELEDASESDSDPGQDTMVEEELSQVIPAKLIQYLIKAGLLERRPKFVEIPPTPVVTIIKKKTQKKKVLNSK